MLQLYVSSDDNEDVTTDYELLLQGGDQKHLTLALPAARATLARIAMALDLIAHPLRQLGPQDTEPSAPNTVAAAACLASAFRGLRAGTLLALSGYTTEARAIVRRTYEAAALARMLAREPALAEKWLRKGEWFPDGKVRQWFGVQAEPDEERTSYQEFYKQTSAYAHPTVVSTLPLLLAADSGRGLLLETPPDSAESLVVLSELAAVGVFVCFALRNALVDPSVLSPGWHHTLAKLTEAPPTHLREHPEAENALVDALPRLGQCSARPADIRTRVTGCLPTSRPRSLPAVVETMVERPHAFKIPLWAS